MSTDTERIYVTLLNFYKQGHSEKWLINKIPNKDDVITINGIKKRVSFLDYVFSTGTDNKTICNIFIHTESLLT